MSRALVLALSAACGGSDPVAPDAPLDASPDAPARFTYRYVMNHQTIPSLAGPSELGLDLDGDSTIDNGAAIAIRRLADPAIDSQAQNDQMTARAVGIMLLELQVEDLTNGPATVELLLGENPVPPACFNEFDTTCGNHLDGTASFTIQSGMPRTGPIAGRFVDGVFTSEPAPHALLTTVYSADAIVFSMTGARVRLTEVSPERIASGVVGGGLVQRVIDEALFPQIELRYTEVLSRECTSLLDPCNCPPGSQAAAILQRFDGNQDCQLTGDEIRGDPEVAELLVTDLVLDDERVMTYGMEFSAVSAMFR